MRVFYSLARRAAALVLGASAVAAGQSAPPDSQRASFAIRVLQLVQGFQMASSPELSAAVNALLEDDGIHMHMLPKRDLASGDSARASEIVKTARAALEKQLSDEQSDRAAANDEVKTLREEMARLKTKLVNAENAIERMASRSAAKAAKSPVK